MNPNTAHLGRLGLAASLLIASTALVLASPVPSVIALNQQVKNGEVAITYANLPKDGYLVIHPSMQSGKLSDTVLGSVQLKAGDHRNIRVKLDKAVAKGTKLWAELQTSNGAGGAEQPITDQGTPAEQSFKVL